MINKSEQKNVEERGKKMNLSYRKLSELIPYEKNPRKNDEAANYVAESIKQFGFKVPIIIDKDDVIVCGHTRYKAAKKLGLKEVPCIKADDLTDEQIKAFRLADNRVGEIAEWDLDLLDEELLGIDNIDMTTLGFVDETPEQKTEPETYDDGYESSIPAAPKSKAGNIYKLGEHFLMCGDSTKESDVAALMNGEQADLVVTDPPYNVDIKNSKGMKIENDNLAREQFHEFLTAVFSCMSDALKPGGAFYVWYASKEIVNFQTSIEENGLTVKQCILRS